MRADKESIKNLLLEPEFIPIGTKFVRRSWKERVSEFPWNIFKKFKLVIIKTETHNLFHQLQDRYEIDELVDILSNEINSKNVESDQEAYEIIRKRLTLI